MFRQLPAGTGRVVADEGERASSALLHQCDELCALSRSGDQYGERGILPYTVCVVQPLTRIHGKCRPSICLQMRGRGNGSAERSAHADEDHRRGGYFRRHRARSEADARISSSLL